MMTCTACKGTGDAKTRDAETDTPDVCAVCHGVGKTDGHQDDDVDYLQDAYQ
jgi:DnaJ-class molecular chaperone